MPVSRGINSCPNATSMLGYSMNHHIADVCGLRACVGSCIELPDVTPATANPNAGFALGAQRSGSIA